MLSYVAAASGSSVDNSANMLTRSLFTLLWLRFLGNDLRDTSEDTVLVRLGGFDPNEEYAEEDVDAVEPWRRGLGAVLVAEGSSCVRLRVANWFGITGRNRSGSWNGASGDECRHCKPGMSWSGWINR